ncbi:hypothetical protein DACRYDRAFT_107092 [Dacryopinax primogenitus]|uniref:Uncharacterized protein n=1 Tax=Dacryopinax primogenitus (strain DJM 731) TaxID=1858805 RepID=M5G8I0_DACPD|nr:uncharacterized protein DACRYDRAFT_107092 [Dacryopinax primogenitus]EJU02157.1 hypothetical protein DACRYDRAFT_107092 [Dacryopinax primogenitus]
MRKDCRKGQVTLQFNNGQNGVWAAYLDAQDPKWHILEIKVDFDGKQPQLCPPPTQDILWTEDKASMESETDPASTSPPPQLTPSIPSPTTQHSPEANVIMMDSDDKTPARKSFGDEDYDFNCATPSLGEEEDEEVMIEEIVLALRQHAASTSTTDIGSRNPKGKGKDLKGKGKGKGSKHSPSLSPELRGTSKKIKTGTATCWKGPAAKPWPPLLKIHPKV